MRFVGYAMRIEIKGLMVSVVLPTVYAKINHPKNFAVEFCTIRKILQKQGFFVSGQETYEWNRSVEIKVNIS